MVERPSSPYRPVSLRHCDGRIPDGHVVPNPPRPAPEPEPAPVYAPRRLRATVLACLAVAALGVLIGVLR